MIYFVKHTDYVKIGYTGDIRSRLSDLQTSCPVRLKVLALIKGDLNDESTYRERFKHLLSNGEWFCYTQELQEFVEGLDKVLLWKYGFEHHDSSPIGEIKRCRLEKNLSMEELGELLGISKQAVLDMETREVQGKISIASLLKALKAMGYKYQYRAIP
jgi:DNA-binding XRE family transcriptional regulator